MSGMPVLLAWAGLWDFLQSIMTPLHAAISLVLMGAYKGWSFLIGADRGITWVLSIMTLVLVVRTILIPLFIRQINSSRNMQLIQPKMKELQEKYGADRQRLGIETQKLMKEEGVSPTASCVPLLLQMPIFFALYQVLYGASQGNAVGYFFVHNPELVASLTRADFLGAKLAGTFWPMSPFGATQIMAMVLVLLMTGLLIVTQRQLMGKNMPPSAMTGQMAQQQKLMMYVFPFVYLFMGVMIPVGVLVYWVTNNSWTLVQQWILIRNNPTPGTPAFIEWEERMIRQGKDPKQIAEERQAKRSRRPVNPTDSRSVGPATNGGGIARQPGAGKSGGSLDGGAGGKTGTGSGSGESGVSRQQIQRQQPPRQTRSNRTIKKKK